jgi:hypothetical protein
MLNRPEPPKPTSWNVYKIDKKTHHSDRCERRCSKPEPQRCVPRSRQRRRLGASKVTAIRLVSALTHRMYIQAVVCGEVSYDWSIGATGPIELPHAAARYST